MVEARFCHGRGLATGSVLGSQRWPAARLCLLWVRCVIRTRRLDRHKTVRGYHCERVCGLMWHGGDALWHQTWAQCCQGKKNNITDPCGRVFRVGRMCMKCGGAGRLQTLHQPCPVLASQGGWPQCTHCTASGRAATVRLVMSRWVFCVRHGAFLFTLTADHTAAAARWGMYATLRAQSMFWLK